MSRWPRGESDIEALLAANSLERVIGAQANGRHLLVKAERTLVSSEEILATDPDNTYVLAYDATRQAATALLAQQGLRPTTSGGHYAVQLAVIAQFGSGFRVFGTLRRRRNELEYPSGPGETTDVQEAREALADARRLVGAATRLLPELGLF